jgi:hypothetical protein
LTTPTPAGNGGVRTIWDLWILDLFGIWKFEDLCIRRLGDCCDFVDKIDFLATDLILYGTDLVARVDLVQDAVLGRP